MWAPSEHWVPPQSPAEHGQLIVGSVGEALPGSTPQHWAAPEPPSLLAHGDVSADNVPFDPRANEGVGRSDLIKEGGELSHTFKIII